MTSQAVIKRELFINRQRRDEQLATPLDIKRGEIAEVDGSIVGDLDYLVWVKPFEGNANPLQMFNPGTVQNLQKDMPVFYKRDPEPPGLWTLVNFDSGTWASDAATFSSLPGVNSPPHAVKHIMQPGNIGPDPLNIFSHAMVDFATRPTQPASMKVRISSGWYPGVLTYEFFSGPANSKDFTSDIPASAGMSIIIAIAIDKAGAVTYVDGIEYVTGEPVPNASRPSVSTDLLLISAVRLDNGMSAIDNENFDHEMRPIFAPGGLARAYIHWKQNNSGDFLLPDDFGVFVGEDDITYDAGVAKGGESFQLFQTAGEASMGFYNFTNSNEPLLNFYRARGIDHTAPTAVADTNSLGQITWYGYGSTDFQAGARVEGLVDGTPSVDDVPVAIRWLTHALGDSDGVVAERMRLTPPGNLGVGIASPDSLGHFHKATAGVVTPPTNTVVTIENSTATYLTLLSPDADPRGVYFGEVTDNDIASLIYNPATLADGLEITVNATVGLSVTDATVLIPGDLVHAGDPDNKIAFTDDVQTFTVGGLAMLTLTEAAQDLITFGPGSGDVDINFNGDMFLQGSDGFLGVAKVAPSFLIDAAGHVRITEANRLKLAGTGASDVSMDAWGSTAGGTFNYFEIQTPQANEHTILRVTPKGAPGNPPTALEFYGTDFHADNANFERLNIRSGSATYLISTEKAGTGTLRPLQITTTGNTGIVIGITGNIGINTSSQFGSGAGVIGIADAGTNPSTNPTGGFVIYGSGGAGVARGASGTITTFAPAEPHCPDCGRDFILQWRNEEMGHLLLCMWCFSETMKRGVVKRDEFWTDTDQIG